MVITPKKWASREMAQVEITEGKPCWEDSKALWDQRRDCEIIRLSVASSTYRGFPMEGSPSFIFRTWAWLFLDSGRLGQVTSEEGFDRLHETISKKLSECWECVAEKPLSCGGAVKLINLLILHVCMHDYELKNREELLRYIHVPLDKYVLTAIRRCETGLEIPADPSMGDVKSYDHYMKIQGFIRELARACGTEPVILNYLAWEETHPVRGRFVEPVRERRKAVTDPCGRL